MAVCSAEDLIIYKCVAGRPRDLEDVRLVIERQSASLDREYIRQTLREFEEALSRNDLVRIFERFVRE